MRAISRWPAYPCCGCNWGRCPVPSMRVEWRPWTDYSSRTIRTGRTNHGCRRATLTAANGPTRMSARPVRMTSRLNRRPRRATRRRCARSVLSMRIWATRRTSLTSLACRSRTFLASQPWNPTGADLGLRGKATISSAFITRRGMQRGGCRLAAAPQEWPHSQAMPTACVRFSLPQARLFEASLTPLSSPLVCRTAESLELILIPDRNDLPTSETSLPPSADCERSSPAEGFEDAIACDRNCLLLGFIICRRRDAGIRQERGTKGRRKGGTAACGQRIFLAVKIHG